MGVSTDRRRRGAVAREPGFRLLLGAVAGSNTANGIGRAALPLLVAAITTDPLALSTLAVAISAPWLLFGLVSGPVIDRLPRLRLLVWLEAARVAVAAGLAALVLADAASLPALLAIGFTLGSLDVFSDNAAQTVVPEVVGKDQSALAGANSAIYGTEVAATAFVGPPLGSGLFAAGRALPFVGAAGLFASSLGLLARMRRRVPGPEPVAATGRSLRAELAEGLRWLWGHRELRALAWLVGAVNLVFGAADAVFVLYATETLGLRPALFGLLLTAAATGSIAGSLVARRVRDRLGTARTLVLALALPALGQAVVAVTSEAWVAGAFFGLSAGGGMIWNVLTVTLRQHVVPDGLLGRVNSAYRFVAWGTMPVGAVLGGAVATVYGLRAPYAVAAATTAAIVAYLAVSGLAARLAALGSD